MAILKKKAFRRSEKMISDERIVDYLNSLDMGNTEFLNDVEDGALSDRVPIIRRETQRLLKFLIKSRRPKNILEVGTAVGFSALLMAQYSDVDTKITTIEKYEKRIVDAKNNFAKSDLGKKITMLEGDADDILSKLSGEYDFIFMDAAKAQYINFYPNVMRLLLSGGILVSDNVLQDGDIVQSRFAVTRRDRTIHKRMREYLEILSRDERLTTTIIPLGDGVALSVKE